MASDGHHVLCVQAVAGSQLDILALDLKLGRMAFKKWGTCTEVQD